MRTPIAIALALAAAPALAAGTTTEGPATNSNGTTGSPAPYHAAKPGQSAQTEAAGQKNAEAADPTRGETQGANIRQQIKGQLEAEGFTNVHVIPDSFLVNARNKDGQTVVMIINPHSVFSMTEVGEGGAGNNGGMASGTQGTSVQHGTAPSTSTMGNKPAQ